VTALSLLHTNEEFVAFLSEIRAYQPKDPEIHIIADNLSTHKTKRVAAFLAQHNNVKMHLHADVLILAELSRPVV
jgi:transposase